MLAVLDDCIAYGESWLHGEVARVLQSPEITPEQQVDAVNRLNVLVGKADEYSAFRIARTIEDLLYRVAPHTPARVLLLQVARRCLRELPSVARQCVIYYATGDQPSDAPARLEMDALLAESLALEDDEQCQRFLIQKLSKQHRSFSSLLGALQSLTQRMDCDRFEQYVVNCLMSPRVDLPSDYFTEWNTATDPASVGPVFQKLHAHVSAGVTPEEAVEHVARGRWKSEETDDGGEDSAPETTSDPGG